MVQQRESDSTRSWANQIGVLAYKYRFNNRMTLAGLGTLKTAFAGAPYNYSTNGTMSLDFKYVHQTLISGIVTSFSNNFKAQQSSELPVPLSCRLIRKNSGCFYHQQS